MSAEEIDQHLELIHLIEPHLVESDHRRKALTNIVLPVVAGRVLYPEERQAAFERAQALAAEAREVGRAPEGAPEPLYLTGTWLEVGMPVWDEARRTEAGSFSGVVETPGAWTFVHVLAVGAEPGEAFGPMTQVTVQRYDVPYIEREATRDMLQSAMDQLGSRSSIPSGRRSCPLRSSTRVRPPAAEPAASPPSLSCSSAPWPCCPSSAPLTPPRSSTRRPPLWWRTRKPPSGRISPARRR